MAKENLNKEYVHPEHPTNKVKIDVWVDEDKLGDLIKGLDDHKGRDPVSHTANIPSEYLSGSVTLK